MKDANAAMTLLENVFSGQFSSSVMAAFASFILSFNCYCWTSINHNITALNYVIM